MNPDPSTPERCSPLDLASPVILRDMIAYAPRHVRAIEANPYYSETAKAAAVREVTAFANNLRNIVSQAVLESQIP